MRRDILAKEREEVLEKAREFVQVLGRQKASYMAGGNTRTVEGAEPNEVKKLVANLRSSQSLESFESLLAALPGSGMASRSNLTRGYYENILKTFRQLRVRWQSLDRAGWLEVLGWAARMM